MAKKYFVVEEGIQLPPKRNGLRLTERRYHYPFKELRVGDSFLVPPDTNKQSMKMQMTRFAQKIGVDIRFATRIMDDRSIRVWRIK